MLCGTLGYRNSTQLRLLDYPGPSRWGAGRPTWLPDYQAAAASRLQAAVDTGCSAQLVQRPLHTKEKHDHEKSN